MALDEPTENDEVQREDGFVIVIDKQLLTQLGGVEIDFRTNKWMGSGFLIRGLQKASGSCC